MTNAIVTIVTGTHFERVFEITGPLIESYSKKVGATLHVLKPSKFSKNSDSKFCAFQVMSQASRTLFIDCDILVKPGAPNAFDVAPAGHFSAVMESPPNRVLRLKQRKLFTTVAKSQGWKPFFPRHYFNAGMFLLDRENADIYAPPNRQLPQIWTSEQALLSMRISRQKIPVHILGNEWNNLWNSPDFFCNLLSCYFIHLNGCKPFSRRIAVMEKVQELYC